MSNKGVCEKMREEDINGGVRKERKGMHESVCMFEASDYYSIFLEKCDEYCTRESSTVSLCGLLHTLKTA